MYTKGLSSRTEGVNFRSSDSTRSKTLRLTLYGSGVLIACAVHVQSGFAAGQQDSEPQSPATLNSSSGGSADANDPIEVRRRFIEAANDAIKRAEPKLRRPHPGSGILAGRVYSVQYNGKLLSYDIQKTNSIVSPYVGVANWQIRWYCDDKFKNLQILEGQFAYQDGIWIFKQLFRVVEGDRYPAADFASAFR